MRYIEGWVSLAESAEVPETYPFPWYLLFGANTHGGLEGVCENLTTNGIVPFPTKEMVEAAADDLRERLGRSFRSVRLRYLRVRIAESDLDLAQFTRRQNLIVIGKMEFGGHEFWGKHREGARHVGYIPGSLWCYNGLKGMRLEAAKHVCSEVRRQGHTDATIASVSLTTAP